MEQLQMGKGKAPLYADFGSRYVQKLAKKETILVLNFREGRMLNTVFHS